MIDLQQFCGNKWEKREWMRAPFQVGTGVCATNGHMAVRVPRDDAPHVVAKSPKLPNNIERLFAAAFDGLGEFAPFPPLPDDVDCPDCKGSGSRDLGDDGPEGCFFCHGNGFKATSVAVGDASFNVHYLHLITALPNATIRTNGSKSAAIQFDGGQALLMPVRV